MARPIQAKASVGAKELIAMLTVFVSTNLFMSYPQYITRSGYEAAWMEPLLSGTVSLVLFLIVERLIRHRFRGMDVVEICKTSFGQVAAVLIALLFAVYFLATTATVMRLFTENVITTVLPATPILVVSLLFMATVWFLAYSGLEGIARTSYLFLPVLIVGIVALCFLTVNWWEPGYLMPIWGSGPMMVAQGGMRYAAIFTNVLLLCVIYPHAHDPKSLRKVGVISIALSSLMLSGFIAVYLLVFPPANAGKTSFFMYQLARMIYFGRFFQRMESIFVVMWVTSAVLKMALSLWAAAYLIGGAFRYPTYRPLLPALALLCFAGAMLPENVTNIVLFDENILQSWGWTVVFGLPLCIVFLASMQRRRRGRWRHG